MIYSVKHLYTATDAIHTRIYRSKFGWKLFAIQFCISFHLWTIKPNKKTNLNTITINICRNGHICVMTIHAYMHVYSMSEAYKHFIDGNVRFYLNISSNQSIFSETAESSPSGVRLITRKLIEQTQTLTLNTAAQQHTQSSHSHHKSETNTK